MADRRNSSGHGHQLGTSWYRQKDLPVGTAYAVWTGVGAVGTVLLGIFLFGDSAAVGRLICVGLILAGIIGLKVFSPS